MVFEIAVDCLSTPPLSCSPERGYPSDVGKLRYASVGGVASGNRSNYFMQRRAMK